MTVSRLLQIVFAALVVAGATLLGVSQQRVWLSVVALLGAIGSLTLTDITGRFRLTGFTANLAALAAVGFALLELTGLTGAVSGTSAEAALARLTSIANLLLYMQLIVMFQTKTVRVYWQLMTLSFLQAIVASALSSSSLFGVLLFGFLVLALLAMILLQMVGDASGLARDTMFQMPGQQGRWKGAEIPLALIDHTQSGSSGKPKFGGDSSMFPSAAVVHRAVARYVGAMTVAAIVIAGALFLLTPRFVQSSPSWLPSPRGLSNRTGYKDGVTFDSNPTPILQDDAIVMRVELFDHTTGHRYSISGPLALRGGVSEAYREVSRTDDGAKETDGQWTPKHVASDDLPLKAKPGQRVYRQQIVMSPLPKETLFSVYPVVKIDDHDPRILYHPIRRMNFRRSTSEPYLLGTTGFYAGHQHPLLRCPSKLSADRLDDLLELSPGKTFKGTRALAARLIREAEIPAARRVAQANVLAEHLRSSGEFTYSLLLPTRTPGIDPIEDFITKHPTGHCEYFASALALMLRSQNIPSRIVTGYKTAEYNSVGDYFQVRQLHAHAWTEAFLKPDQIPENLKMPGQDYSNGAWLTLDATPAGASAFLEDDEQSLWASLKNVFDHVDLLWQNYVVSYSARRQRQLVYDPVLRAYASVVENVRSGQWTREILDAIWHPIKTDGWGVMSVLRSLATLLYSLLFTAPIWVVLYFAITRLGPVVRRMFGAGFARRDGSSMGAGLSDVEFYRRFERMMSRHGLQRGVGETQREFAMSISGQLAENRDSQPVSRLPAVVADAFYRVRFGEQPLDRDQTEAICQALSDLEQALAGTA